MSRTKKGAKGVGYEYWGKRPMNCSPPGSVAKQLTHAIERAQAKQALLKEPHEPEWDEREDTYCPGPCCNKEEE